MFHERSKLKELMDDFSLENEALIANFQEIEATNRWLGSERAMKIALNSIYQSYYHYFKCHSVKIHDLGCGSGDMLRAAVCWAKKKKLNLNFIGLDANQFILKYAESKSQNYKIDYYTTNLLSNDFEKNSFDVAMLNTVCHHFSDDELIKLVKQLYNQTRLAIIINDFHRHWLPYTFIKIVSRAFSFSYLSQHDGPLSILKAFRKNDLTRLLLEANIDNYSIKWIWPFRWLVVIKPKGLETNHAISYCN